ncbi:MAG: hypothetical protein EBY16_00930 [Gammaproteobacteria bacterium]|nr:hypothetical protein [Gammaproteobacteria bacterium]
MQTSHELAINLTREGKDINERLPITQVVEFLQGRNLDTTEEHLQTYARVQETNAKIALAKEDLNIFEKAYILKLLVDERQITQYLKDYETWLTKKKIDETMLSFLEFLAYKKHHRLKTFLKLADKSNPKPVYWPHFTGGAVITVGAIAYFSAKPNHLHLILDWITQQAPLLAWQFINYICLPINIPKVSMVINSFSLAYTLGLLWNNHVTDTAHKVEKTIKYCFQTGIILLAQFLCYLQQGNLPPSISILFILSSLSTTLFSFKAWMNLAKPSLQNGLLTKPEQIQQIEDKYYYKRKERELLIEYISLAFITAGSTVVIFTLLPAPYLSVFFLALQFFINMAKNEYLKYYENKIAEEMQTEISNVFQNSPTPPISPYCISS